jgi:nicotinamide mononucleotide transporter
VEVVMDPVEVAAVLFGIVSVYLSVRENILSWPTAIVNVGLYILVFYRAKLYADMGLQVFYLGVSFYGWWAWLHGGHDRGALQVTRTPRLWLVGLAVAGLVFSLALGAFLRRATDAALPFLDSALSSYSIVAQVMMTRKWLENWALWMALDVVYVGMFVFKRLYLTAGLYAVFLALAAMGLAEWRRSLRAAVAAA